MISAWTDLSTTTQSGVSTQINTTITILTQTAASMTSIIDNSVGPLFSNSSLYSQLTTGLSALYGIIFGLALLGFISTLILACCTVVRIRLMMYCTCSGLAALAVITFILLIVVGVAVPNVAQVCSYTDRQIATSAGAALFFSNIGIGQVGNLISQCMSDGTGIIMDKLSPTFNTSFTDILTISHNVLNFNTMISSFSVANLTTPFTSAYTTITSIQNAQTLDINNSVALSFIDAVRTVSITPSIACNLGNVNGDSWMPSYNLYVCPGGKAKNAPCPNLASTSSGNCPLGCYQILNELASAAGDTSYATTLQTRYNAGCNYYTFVTNLHANWNLPRKAKMITVTSNLNNIQTNVGTYATTTQAIQANISSFSTILQTNFNSTTNLATGSFNGVDCRVIGQTITDLRNSVCVGFLVSLNYNLIVLAIISYGVLLLSCCVVCAGVRHYKHLQKMQVHIGYKGIPVTISQKRLNDSIN